jgi:hypothetical protein
MMYPTDLLHTLATERQRSARERAEERRRRRDALLEAPFAGRYGLPRLALG